MKILIIKLSSIGDLIHTFPAIIDAKNSIKDITFDWLVDENFESIPKLLNLSNNNNVIEQIISIPLRKLKQTKNFKDICKILIKLLKQLFEVKRTSYDVIIDAQGLLKSSLIAKFITFHNKYTIIAGFNWHSCRESLASCFYNRKFFVEKQLHAVTRIRKLFAAALEYNFDINKQQKVDYGIYKHAFPKLPDLIDKRFNKYIVFLHGTTWETKHWHSEYWEQLNRLLVANKIPVVITFHNSNIAEQKFVKNLAFDTNILVLSKLDLEKAASMLANATAVVAVDTGFAHLAGAFGIPVVAIYGATCSQRSSVFSNNCINLQSTYHCSPCLSKECLEYKYKRSSSKQPCLTEITPEIVFAKLQEVLMIRE